MPGKEETKVKKTVAKKTAAKPVKTAAAVKTAKATRVVKKSTAPAASRSKVSQGDNLVCDVCGLSIIVDEFGDAAVIPEFICCEQTMKKKASRAKAAAR